MSIGAVGAIGGLGIGSVGGINVARQANTIQTLGFSPSAQTDITSSTQISLSSDGLQANAGWSELVHALITAMMIQMIQGN